MEYEIVFQNKGDARQIEKYLKQYYKNAHREGVSVFVFVKNEINPTWNNEPWL
jgi:hypothetical protein